uniref:KIF-binding protein n=1 Tax=Trichobilharzia regenti TaxID=157069 RepID=A0AA85JSR6_TRIRE|nr:unnamed protein product [Trichobilharzia regenti]
MIRVEHFLRENKSTLHEVHSLESITLEKQFGDSHFKFRNAARKKYRELLQKFEGYFPKINTSTHFLYWGFLRIKLAINYLDLGDASKAQEILSPCVNNNDRFRSISSLISKITENEFQEKNCLSAKELVLFNSIAGVLQTLFNVLAAIQVINMQNKQLSTSDSKPMHWLRCAQRVYKIYVRQNPPNTGPEFWDTLVFQEWNRGQEPSGGYNGSDLSISRVMFENGYTTTLFLMAQVHQLAGERSLSADHCQLTLLRQLTFAKPLMKAVNSVSSIRMSKKLRAKSAHLFRDLEQDKFTKQTGETITHSFLSIRAFDPVEWATNAVSLSDYFSSIEGPNKYYHKTFECLLSAIHIIEEAKNTCVKKKDDYTLNQMNNTLANIYRDIVRISLDLLEVGANSYEKSTGKQITSIKVDKDHSKKRKTAGEFGSMFNLELKPIFARLLDCNADLQRTKTNQHEMKTKECCMHKRRIDMLSDVLKQLNPDYYLNICLELTFELAGAVSTLRDLKKKIFDEKAYIYTARLYSHQISFDNNEKIQNLTKALEFYVQTVNIAEHHIKSHPETLIKNCEEVRIAKEMVSLLPVKLGRLSRGESIPD